MKKLLTMLLAGSIFMFACKSASKTQKGAAIGTVGGGATGAVIGRAAGNTALGAIIGAAVGGVTGAVIGHHMDKQAEEMKNEIPNAKIERVGEGIVVEFSEKILFGFDSYDLTATAKSNLDKVAQNLQKYPDTDVQVQGHTDSKGTEAYNQSLSEKRASAVSSYLSQNGVPSSRLSTKAYGETAPKYTNETDEGRAQNRRVEFLISANEKMKSEAKKEAETTK